MTDENPNVMPTNSNNPFIMKTTLEPLAPGHLGEIMLREIRQQWLNQQLVDYTLVTADGVEFRVHRSHIACFCDYISAMLSGEYYWCMAVMGIFDYLLVICTSWHWCDLFVIARFMLSYQVTKCQDHRNGFETNWIYASHYTLVKRSWGWTDTGFSLYVCSFS